MSFPKTLRDERAKQQLSQSQLADRAGFDHSYVSRLEKGERSPKVESIKRLAIALGYDEDSDDTERLMSAAGYLGPNAINPRWPSVTKLHEFLERTDIPEYTRLYTDHIIRDMIDMIDVFDGAGGNDDLSGRTERSD